MKVRLWGDKCTGREKQVNTHCISYIFIFKGHHVRTPSSPRASHVLCQTWQYSERHSQELAAEQPNQVNWCHCHVLTQFYTRPVCHKPHRKCVVVPKSATGNISLPWKAYSLQASPRCRDLPLGSLSGTLGACWPKCVKTMSLCKVMLICYLLLVSSPVPGVLPLLIGSFWNLSLTGPFPNSFPHWSSYEAPPPSYPI